MLYEHQNPMIFVGRVESPDLSLDLWEREESRKERGGGER